MTHEDTRHLTTAGTLEAYQAFVGAREALYVQIAAHSQATIRQGAFCDACATCTPLWEAYEYCNLAMCALLEKEP